MLHLRPNAASQSARDKMLAEVRDFLEQSQQDLDLAAFDKAVAIVHIAEDGHHRILGALQQTAFAKEPAPVRAAAVIARAEANRVALIADMEASLKAAGRLTMPNGPAIELTRIPPWQSCWKP